MYGEFRSAYIYDYSHVYYKIILCPSGLQHHAGTQVPAFQNILPLTLAVKTKTQYNLAQWDICLEGQT
jgi:hypothetical protein